MSINCGISRKSELELRRATQALVPEVAIRSSEWEHARDMGLVRDYDKDADEMDREAVARVIATCVASLRRLDLSHTSGARRETAVEPARDARWDLLADLHAAGRPDAERWSPIRISRNRMLHLDLEGLPSWQTVRVEFDHRLSYSALADGLKRAWPLLRKERTLRRTRHLEDRQIGLVRHVCLDGHIGDSWPERFKEWNRRWRRRHPNWEFPDRRAFRVAFHRAERQLTGDKYGLAKYYMPAARLSSKELSTLVGQGDQDAMALWRFWAKSSSKSTAAIGEKLERYNRTDPTEGDGVKGSGRARTR